jgi:hypothetical protein
MNCRLLASLAVTAAAFGLSAWAADPPRPAVKGPEAKNKAPAADDTDPRARIDEAANQQERLRRQFGEFKESLLRLKQRFESSPKPEEREKAKVLEQALALASAQGVDTKFTTLVGSLRSSDAFKDLDQLQGMLDRNEDLRKDLRALIELLSKDDQDAERRRKQEEYNRLLTRLKEVIRKQEQARTRTERRIGGPSELEKVQKKVTQETRDLLTRREAKANPGGEGKKAEAKNAGKDGTGPRGEPKNDAKDPKGESRGAEKKGDAGKEAKPGEGREGKPGEGKEAKPGAGSEGKEAKPGEGKESKPGEGKEPGKPADGKPGEKPGEPKDGAAKPPEPKSGTDSKARGEGKGDAKPGQGAEGKGGEKAAQSKGSQGGQQGQQAQNKGEQSEQGQKGDQKQGDQQAQQGNPAQKKIQEGVENQEKAENKIAKNDKKATEDQDEAIKKLNEAKKQLEELLRQLREEEIERVLAQLQQRCEKMLAMQIAVRDGTVSLDRAIDRKDPTREQQQQSNVLSDKEEEILREAGKAEAIVRAEGSAVAFGEVFQQLRGDMTTAAARLRRTDTGPLTVSIENDIIATLQEMVEALKKARKENQNKQQQQQQQGGGQQNQRLIDLIAELKMIRSMQVRVNSRTVQYGRQYEGEQAPPLSAAADAKARELFEAIQNELHDLAVRQDKIKKVTDDIAKGKNKAN